MDVKQIHHALVTIWPGGIPREAMVYLAGMIKVLVDKAGEGVGVASTAQTELEQALAAVAPTGTLQAHATNPKTGKFERRPDLDIPVPVALKSRAMPPKVLKRVKDYLAGAQLTRAKGRSQDMIAKDLDLGPWTVKRAVWQLQKEGAIERVKAVQGSHLYQLRG